MSTGSMPARALSRSGSEAEAGLSDAALTLRRRVCTARARVPAQLVAIDQESDMLIARREVCLLTLREDYAS